MSQYYITYIFDKGQHLLHAFMIFVILEWSNDYNNAMHSQINHHIITCNYVGYYRPIIAMHLQLE